MMQRGPQALVKALERSGQGDIALLGHVIADFPTPKDARKLIATMVQAGVACIEIQIPFSEPVADGPIFMAANQKALEQGNSVDQSFEMMSEVSASFEIPFVFMTYANIVFQIGFHNFVRRSVACGAQGMIVPDLPFELAEELYEACKEENFAWIAVVPPNVDDKRLEFLCQKSSGFIYAAARRGVTGTHTKIGVEVHEFLKRVRLRSSLPVVCGFGIQNRSDVQSLLGHVDAVVIGSRSLEEFNNGGHEGVKRFWENIISRS